MYSRIQSYQLPFQDTGQTAHGPGGLPQFADVHWMTFDTQRFIKGLGLGIAGRHHDFPQTKLKADPLINSSVSGTKATS